VNWSIIRLKTQICAGRFTKQSEAQMTQRERDTANFTAYEKRIIYDLTSIKGLDLGRGHRDRCDVVLALRRAR
jgi:hypothetical protein